MTAPLETLVNRAQLRVDRYGHHRRRSGDLYGFEEESIVGNLGTVMTQVVVDIDQRDLAEVKGILGATKDNEAVRMAIREVIAAKARCDAIELFAEGSFTDLGDPAVRAASWS